MIIPYKDSNGTEIIFVDDLENDKKEYLRLNNLIKKDGEVYKSVKISSSIYSFPGSPQSLNTTKIVKKDGSSVHMLENDMEWSGNIDSSGMDTFMHMFGNDVILDVSGVKTRPMRSHGHALMDHDGTEYSITTEPDNSSTNFVNSMVSWMTRDNGRVVLPMIEKFLYICRMSRNDPNRLTGYVNMKKYTKMLNSPSTFKLGNGNQLIITGKPTIRIESVNGGYLHAKIDGISIVSTVNEPTPYSLFTARPMKAGSETLPFFTMRYKGITIFVSTVILNNDSFIKSMHGGVDLLK